jgi:PAS domain S-box-containing protein
LTLRRKTLVIIALTVAGLVVALYSLSNLFLLRNYRDLEEQYARENLDRAANLITDSLDELNRSAGDYSSSDQTYAFVRGKNSKVPASQFSPETLARLHIYAVFIADNSGRLLFAKTHQTSSASPDDFLESLKKQLRPGSPFLVHGDPKAKKAGILMLPDAPLLMVSRPVLTSRAEGPVMGTLVMVRALDAGFAQHMAQVTQFPLAILRLDDVDLPAALRKVATLLSPQQPVLFQPVSQNELYAYRLLTDLKGNPAVVLRLTLSRGIYQQGRASLLHFLLLLAAAGLLFGVVTLILLERLVVSRVTLLSSALEVIHQRGDLSGRVSASGSDEITRLAAEINRIFEAIEKSKQALLESEENYRKLVEEAPYGILCAAPRGALVTANQALAEMVGYSSPQDLTATVRGLDLFMDAAEQERLTRALAAHEKLSGFETQWRRKDGKPISVRIGGRAVRNVHGRVVQYELMVENTTERKLLEEQLRKSQRMEAVGRLAGGVAHDFNNLLMVIQGYSDVLVDRLQGQDYIHKQAVQIRKAADRAAGLTRQLLAFSRMQMLQPQVLDLNGVIQDLAKMLPRLLGEDIELFVSAAPELGRVKADLSQMEQVILNLAVNARDAMPEGGRLTMETSNVFLDEGYGARYPNFQPGEYVQLAVTDTGMGMDDETIAHMFEPFFTTKEPGKGTGLGLATVYGVVKQSGGWIWVYSEPGKGACFKVLLPRVDAPVTAAAAPVAGTQRPRGSETILLVEDQEAVRELARDFLKSSGYNVLDAGLGSEAMEIAARHQGPIHLLVTDVIMPKMNGRELADRLMAARPEMKVLFMSGFGEYAAVQHDVIKRGAPSLQKPFSMDVLARKVREVLETQPVVS